MNISVIIPQVFYDLIARMLPGVFFSILALLSFPEWVDYVSPLASTEKNNFVQSLGQGFIYAAICYFLGWVFFAFSSDSKREEAKKENEIPGDNKSLDAKYQWIRLVHSSAGFRIVKLRAEARMFQATRTGMIAILGLTFVYIAGALLFLKPSLWPPEKAFWLRPVVGLLIAGTTFFRFETRERKAWNYYWKNINAVYGAFHDTTDPIPPFAGPSSHT